MTGSRKAKSLGEWLKLKRIKAELTQAMVADELGYDSPQYISNWERCISTPPMHQLRKIVDLYGIPEREMINALLEHQKSIIMTHLKSKTA